MLIDRKVLAVLVQLHDGSERSAESLVANSRGVLSKATVCVLLGRMEDEKMIEGRDEDLVATERMPGHAGRRNKVYGITAHGRQRMAVTPMATVVSG